MHPNHSDAIDRSEKIKLLLLDVDGVLTGGDIIYDDSGQETKIFNVKDGLGIRLLMDAGIDVAIVTGRCSNALIHRCRNLGIDQVYDGVTDKAATFDRIIKQTQVQSREVACMGDDLPDLPLMGKVGFSIAVADAHEAVLSRADVVTLAKGGAGAVREACEFILKSKGLWESVLKRFT